MEETKAGAVPPRSGQPRWGRKGPLVAAGVAVVVLAGVVIAVAVGGLPYPASDPRFTSLAAHPDASLQGTVAYYADAPGCVRVVAAAGRPVKDVLCPAPQDPSVAAKQGKEIGPHLAWLPGGRLEVTMFRWADEKGERLKGDWQKIIDVRTGSTEDVPAARVPSTPPALDHPTVSPSGGRITSTSDEGRVEVRLSDNAGSRSLLNVRGSPYYRLDSAFWAPSWQWVVADDGRILIITTGRPPRTRVLTDESRSGGDERLARFAVTGANILTGSG